MFHIVVYYVIIVVVVFLQPPTLGPPCQLARIHSSGERSSLRVVFSRRFWHRSCPICFVQSQRCWWDHLHWMCRGEKKSMPGGLDLRWLKVDSKFKDIQSSMAVVAAGKWGLLWASRHFEVSKFSGWTSACKNVEMAKFARCIHCQWKPLTRQLRFSYIVVVFQCISMLLFKGFSTVSHFSWTRQAGCALRYPSLPTWWIRDRPTTLWRWASRSNQN